MRFAAVLVVFLVCYSCKKETVAKPDSVVKGSLPDLNEFDDSLPDPAEKSVTKEGEVTFGADTFEVIEEFTDNISLIAHFSDGDNGRQMTMHKYRNKVVHLVNKKTQDRITIEKETFRKYINTGEFNELLLQAVLFDQQSKTGNIPLMINLCKPDTDLCEFFIIAVDEDKNLKITLFQEDNFVEE